MGGGARCSPAIRRPELGAQPAVLVGLDPDAVEEGEFDCHDRYIMRAPARHLQVLTGGKSALADRWVDLATLTAAGCR